MSSLRTSSGRVPRAPRTRGGFRSAAQFFAVPFAAPLFGAPFFGALLAASGCTPATPVDASSPSEERVLAPLPEDIVAEEVAPHPKTQEPPAPARRCGMPSDLPEPSWPRRLEPTAAEEPTPYVPGAITFAVLPDTQYYVDCRAPHVKEQSAWLDSQRERRNLRAVVQLGDLTENNWREEWQFLKESFAPLDPSLPLILAPGNHDNGDNGTSNRRFSYYSEYFDLAFAGRSGALVETADGKSAENAFYQVRVDGIDFGFLVLEWSPRARTVAWANDVLQRHPKHRTVVLTHAYLYSDDTRYDFARKGKEQKWNPLVYGTARGDEADDPHDGEMLWQSLIKKHRGIFLTLNGHVLNDGVGLLTSRGDAGNTVHQMLVNYQMLDDGGLGYLRLLEIQPDKKTLRVKTYSPTLGVFATAPEQDFSLKLDPPLNR